jgi:hypothetical protein
MGTTMGAQFSVNYANIYMHMWFRKFNQHFGLIFPPGFGRFVDDIFLCWLLELQQLNQFVIRLNNFHESIKFEVETSTTSVHFLDTLVYVEDGLLKTKVFTKPSDRKQYLAYNSSHPKHIKTAIPYSQAIRYKRIISDESILISELNTLKTKFLHRGYPERLINSGLTRLHNTDRQMLLQYNTVTSKQDRSLTLSNNKPWLPLILSYWEQYDNKDDNNIRKIITELWTKFVNSDKDLQNAFANTLPQVVYTRGRTIGNYLIRSALNNSVLTTEDWELVKLLQIDSYSTKQTQK